MSETSTATAPVDGPGRPDPRRWWILALIGIGQLMIVLDATIVNIALPSMQDDLGFSVADRQWALTAYTLPFGGLLLFGGRIADFTGRRRAMIIGVLGFGAASAAGGAATEAWMLFAARGLQGAFGALLAPALLSTLAVTFTDPKERGTAFGIFGALAGGGSAIGLMLGGVLTDYLSWRWCLYVNVPIAAAVGLGAMVLIRESAPSGRPRFDVPGAVLGGGGLAALIFAFTKAETDGWTATVTLASLWAAGAALVLFVLVEGRFARTPLLPLRVVTDRNRGGSYLAVLTIMFALFGTMLLLTFHLQRVLGYSPLKTGVAFLPLTAAIVIGSTGISARLLNRVPTRALMGPGLALAAAGLVHLSRLDLGDGYLAGVLPAQILLGLGMGLVIMPAISTATHGVDRGDAGVASAMVNTSQQVGGSIGAALLNTVAAGAAADFLAGGVPTGPARAAATVEGLNAAMVVGAGVLVAMALVVLTLVDARPADVNSQAGPDGTIPDGGTPAVGTPAGGTPAGGTPDGTTQADTALADGTGDSVADDSVPGDAVTVTAAVTGTVRDADGAPVPGATVTVLDAAGAQLDRVLSDRTGGYTVTGHHGPVVLVCTAVGLAPVAELVLAGANHTLRDLQARRNGRLSGTIRSANTGAAVPDALVTLTNGDRGPVGEQVTGPDGRFEFTDLDSGDYTVTATGYRPTSATVAMRTGRAEFTDLTLRPSANT